jgi:hypothetical protein
MSAYHLTMAFYTPGVEAGKPGVVLNIPGALEHKEERFREGFRARQYVFQNERVDQSRFHEINPYMGDILGYRGVKYSYLYSAFQVDPCRPVVYRADFIPLGVDRILRARLGLELDIPFDRLGMLVHWQDMLKGLGADGAMMRSIGCASPKLFVVFAPHVVTCLSEAADYIRNVHDIDRAPVILTRVSRESRCASAGVDRFGSSDLASGAEIEVLHFTANSLELTARVPRQAEDAWLIYLDSYHSGWKATVNGRRTEVAVANLAFKAVPLDSGKNHVQFVFKGYGERTPIFGIIIFVFGVIGSLALFGLSVLVSIFKNASGRQCI